jgi:hypothetical protein
MRRNMNLMLGRKTWMIGAMTLLLGGTAQTAPAAVVELFTSQGCNDCPPADALLGELGRVPGVIALAYHVTYWDALGWHDRFELSQADELQESYVKQLRLPAAFTPQAVIDGRISAIGSDRRAISTALGSSRATIPVALALSGGQVHIELSAQTLSTPVTVVLVGYLPEVTTKIGGGENAGRALEEFDVVRSYRVVGVWRGSAAQLAVPLSSLPPEAPRIVVLLRSPAGVILGAATLAVR